MGKEQIEERTVNCLEKKNSCTFNNISAILLMQVLLVKETGVPKKTIHMPKMTDIKLP